MTFDPKAAPDARLAAVQGLVKTLNADRHPIVLGPFSSELGFEVMYWIPFLTKLKSLVQDFDKRAVVITRGGAGCLYTQVASQGIDLYAIRTVTDVRRASLKQYRKTKLQKQVQQTPWEDQAIKDAARAHGLMLPYHVIHPMWMYWACEPYWSEIAGLSYLLALCDYAPLQAPKALPTMGLPEKYVAGKWYGRATFPYPDPDVAQFVKTTTATVAAQVPVVCLDTADAFDDHADIYVQGKNIGHIGKQAAPFENLAIQAAVIAGATGFVGTYGGTAQLALRLGRPSVSFYKDWGGTSHGHLALNSWISKQTGVPFLVGSLVDTHLWGQVTSVPPQVIPQVKALPQAQLVRA